MNEYVTLEALADYFKVSMSTARKWVSSGFIPESTYISSGESKKLYRFNLQAVEQAILGKQMDLPLEEDESDDPRRFYRPKGDTK